MEPSHGPQSQRLTLDEWSRFVDMPLVAEGFMLSARALGVPPRVARKLGVCENRFRVNWGQVLKALQGVEVDTRQVLLAHTMLRRILPSDIAKLVLDMYARFPVQIDDAPLERKRPRRALSPKYSAVAAACVINAKRPAKTPGLKQRRPPHSLPCGLSLRDAFYHPFLCRGLPFGRRICVAILLCLPDTLPCSLKPWAHPGVALSGRGDGWRLLAVGRPGVNKRSILVTQALGAADACRTRPVLQSQLWLSSVGQHVAMHRRFLQSCRVFDGSA